jgi:hypothetical protein
MRLASGRVIDGLALIAQLGVSAEFANRVEFLPLR